VVRYTVAGAKRALREWSVKVKCLLNESSLFSYVLDILYVYFVPKAITCK